jgi:hypothetical protein
VSSGERNPPCLGEEVGGSRLRRVGYGCPVCGGWIPSDQIQRMINELKRTGVPELVKLGELVSKAVNQRDDPAYMERVVPSNAEVELLLRCLDIVEKKFPGFVSLWYSEEMRIATRDRLRRVVAYNGGALKHVEIVLEPNTFYSFATEPRKENEE